MKTAGIIAEYNPFHNGHKYLIDEAKKECGAVAAVMSGSFVQRGGAAVFDKYVRAGAAVLGGCDLVIELPVCFSLSSAADFARGGVGLLNRLGIIDYLYFGAERADIDELTAAAEKLSAEPPETAARVKEYVRAGMSYPAAYSKAWGKSISADILGKPNNILAVEYIKALKQSKSRIVPVCAARTGAEHDGGAEGVYASASHIRGMIGRGEDYSMFVPRGAYEIYKSAAAHDISLLDGFITGTLRVLGADELEHYFPEGLHNRVKAAANDNYGFDAICAAVKSKRYTLSRVRRSVLAAALRLPKPSDTDYARILALNGTGRELLREIKAKSDIDIITKTAAYDGENEMFKADLRASDIFGLCSLDEGNRKGGADFTTSPSVI